MASPREEQEVHLQHRSGVEWCTATGDVIQLVPCCNTLTTPLSCECLAVSVHVRKDPSATQRQVKALNLQTQDQAVSKMGTEGRQVLRETTTESGQVKLKTGMLCL